MPSKVPSPHSGYPPWDSTCSVSAQLDAQVSGEFILLIWTRILRRDESPSGSVSFTSLMTEGTQMSSTDMPVFQTANIKDDLHSG